MLDIDKSFFNEEERLNFIIPEVMKKAKASVNKLVTGSLLVGLSAISVVMP